MFFLTRMLTHLSSRPCLESSVSHVFKISKLASANILLAVSSVRSLKYLPFLKPSKFQYLNDEYMTPVSFKLSFNLLMTSLTSVLGTCSSDADAHIPSNSLMNSIF